jgi:probable phosphoglycerate mutase
MTAPHHARRAAMLLFARHGATGPNLAGLRCGGDLDPPLAEAGRQQAVALGRALRALAEPPDLIVTSDLLRTRETAAIVRAVLGARGPARAGRRCASGGWAAWNLQPIEATEGRLAGGQHTAGWRVGRGLQGAHRSGAGWPGPALLQRRVLLVGSKGVGRVLRDLCRACHPASRWAMLS